MGFISIEKPQILLFALILIPALILIHIRCLKILRSFAHDDSASPEGTPDRLKTLRRALFGRTALRSLAWIFAVLACAEISWGTKNIPVHKSGSTVHFVFDISYSMLAKDAPRNMTRLDAAKAYASALLKELPNSSFSAILAKGGGYVAIPETEDAALMETLLENLSPKLMTSAGSSLGKGIEAALNAIPATSAKSQHIWVFTDGDETDNQLEKSLETAQRFGIPVTLIGFGSESETEITAGDGKTRVKTALRSQKLRELAENANKRAYSRAHGGLDSSVSYIDSRESGSAWKLLRRVQAAGMEAEGSLSYEVRAVNRHSLFVFLAVASLILSFVVAELSRDGIRAFRRSLSAAPFFALVLFLASCSSERKQVLEGVWAWYEGKYPSATADFLNTASTAQSGSLAHTYAIFDLSATYLSMSEADSSLERLEQLNLADETLPAAVRSAAFYNMGVIFEQKNDFTQAAQCFRKAILADGRNTRAKINLELCGRELIRKQAKSAEAQMQGVSEQKADNSDMTSEIFNLIHESEGKKWRNMTSGGGETDDVLDY